MPVLESRVENVDESRGGDIAQDMELIGGGARPDADMPRDIHRQNGGCRGIADELRTLIQLLYPRDSVGIMLEELK